MSYFSIGDAIETWFRHRMKALQLLDHTQVSLSSVISVAKKYLPSKLETVLEYISDPSDSDEWLDKLFKMDAILKIEQIDGTMQRVGIDITGNLGAAQSKLEEITRLKFQAARDKLGIDRHWIIVVNPKDYPSDEQLSDSIYTAVDLDEKCVIINMY
jgi:hypothetical protein